MSQRPPDASRVELVRDTRPPSRPSIPGGPPRDPSRAKRIARGALLFITLTQFRRNRMARFGALAIACIALAAIFADVLASDLPIVCRVHGVMFVLPNVTRPEALAGYDNDRIAREKDAGDWAITPLVHYGPKQVAADTTRDRLRPPTIFGAHPLGTDSYGRDVFARLVHGARTSLGAALFAALAFVLIGTTLGALGGFVGGAFDAVVSRLIETLSSFPTLVLVLVVQALLAHPTMLSFLLTIGLTRWPEVARLVRAEVLLVSAQDYVVAARALGASPARVLTRHVVPNAFAPILVTATFGVASVILIEASLDFLRVGIPVGSASWGETLSETREHLGAWWLLVFPGLAVFVTVMALNLVGEALRDALDPRLRAAALVGRTGDSPASRPGGALPPSTAAIDESTHA